MFTPLFQNPHLQTIAAHMVPARLPRHFPTQERIFDTEAGTRVVGHFNFVARRPGEKERLLVIMHGLTGSSRSVECRRLARRALQAGFSALRLNIRNCGRTEHLTPTLYHSGFTADLDAVVRGLAPADVFLAGYSIGGNIVLKLAGEWGASPPAHVRGLAAISPPVDLAVCARALGARRNRIYERRFLRRLEQLLRRKSRAYPGLFSLDLLSGVRNIIDFDNAYTAPAFSFRDADDYYAHASAAPLMDRLLVPSLILAAEDDPFIPFHIYEAARRSASIQFKGTRHGGHTAFLSRGRPLFWAEDQVVRFLAGLG